MWLLPRVYCYFVNIFVQSDLKILAWNAIGKGGHFARVVVVVVACLRGKWSRRVIMHGTVEQIIYNMY
jgi:hypothetical protein